MLSETNCEAKLKSTGWEFSINSKIRQIVNRTAVLKNTTESRKLTLPTNREKKRISQCRLTKMPCNIDDENKAPHNKLQSYWDDFLFNNELPSALGVNTASVCGLRAHARGGGMKKHLSSMRTKLLYLICTENKQACGLENKTGAWHAEALCGMQIIPGWAGCAEFIIHIFVIDGIFKVCGL